MRIQNLRKIDRPNELARVSTSESDLSIYVWERVGRLKRNGDFVQCDDCLREQVVCHWITLSVQFHLA